MVTAMHGKSGRADHFRDNAKWSRKSLDRDNINGLEKVWIDSISSSREKMFLNLFSYIKNIG